MENYKTVSEVQSEGMKRLESLTVTVEECVEITGIGINKLRNLVHTDGFPVVWNGKKALIIKTEIEPWLIANIGKRI